MFNLPALRFSDGLFLVWVLCQYGKKDGTDEHTDRNIYFATEKEVFIRLKAQTLSDATPPKSNISPFHQN